MKNNIIKTVLMTCLVCMPVTTSAHTNANPNSVQHDHPVAQTTALANNQDFAQINSLLEQIATLTEIVASLQKQLALLSTQPQIPDLEGYVFKKDLSLGDRDMEVILLQKALNKAGFTVSNTGAGSIGNETNYFGKKTKDALKKLQAQTAARSLHPAGNFLPTGVVDFYTRNILNEIAASRVTAVGEVVSAHAPRVNSIFPTSGSNGSTITIFGSNFHPTNNTIYTNVSSHRNIPSPDGTTLQFVIYSANIAIDQMNASQIIYDPNEVLLDELLDDDHAHSASFDDDAYLPTYNIPQAIPVEIEVVNDFGMSNSVIFNLE